LIPRRAVHVFVNRKGA